MLDFLAAQKIATANQVESFCFSNNTRSYIWKVIKKLKEANLIISSGLRLDGKRQHFGYQLTSQGLDELRLYCSDDPGKLQIASNSPVHDITLTDIRILFSRIKECSFFLPENILATKIFEKDIAELSAFRSLRCDSAALLAINGKKTWLSVEFERSQKTLSRYKERLHKWYQAENISGILMITENQNLINKLSEIDRKTSPRLARKILYLSKAEALSANKQIQFFDCNNESLTFTLNDSLNAQYPILSQSFANL